MVRQTTQCLHVVQSLTVENWGSDQEVLLGPLGTAEAPTISRTPSITVGEGSRQVQRTELRVSERGNEYPLGIPIAAVRASTVCGGKPYTLQPPRLFCTADLIQQPPQQPPQ